MAILNELLASGMTFKQWLFHMLQVTNEADVAVAKALRHMLGVFKYFFFKFLVGGSGYFSETVTVSEFSSLRNP